MYTTAVTVGELLRFIEANELKSDDRIALNLFHEHSLHYIDNPKCRATYIPLSRFKEGTDTTFSVSKGQVFQDKDFKTLEINFGVQELQNYDNLQKTMETTVKSIMCNISDLDGFTDYLLENDYIREYD